MNIKEKEKQKPMKAIIYSRVSSDEQVKGFSLKSQEDACRQRCEREGWKVIKVFVEKGESAKTEKRTQLLSLLGFLKERRKNEIDFLVVWKIDRFSRSVDAHHWIKAHLNKYGVRLVSVTEQIDDTPTGKFMENFLAANAQWDNDVRSERTTIGMKECLKSGRWCWTAPLGYKNIHIGDVKTIVPDDKAPFIKRLFEEYATSLYTIKQVTQKANRWGLRTKKGKRLSPQTISKILIRKAYMGVAESRKWGIETQGKWEALVEPEIWQKAQDVKSGKAINNAPRNCRNPDFPLRAFAKCPDCGNPLTASWSQGRSKKYGYYRCHRCKTSPSIAKNELESAFLELLKLFQPSEEYVELFKAVILDVWKKKHKGRTALTKKINEEIDRFEDLKSTLIRKNAEGVFTDEDLKRELERIGEEVLVKKMALKDSEISEVELEGIVNAAENFLTTVGPFWRDAGLEQKQRFQQLVFPEGVTYKNGEFETTRIARTFSVIEESEGVRERLVAPRGIEPLFSP